MRTRTWLGLLAAGLVIAFAAVSGACKNGGSSSDDGLTLEEYFQQLDEAEDTYRATTDLLGTRFSELSETDFAGAASILQDAQDSMDTFVAELQEIDPPAETATAHAETIAGFQASSGLMAQAIPQIAGATNMGDALGIFSSDEFTSVSDSLNETCAALQSIADSNNIEVDLSCENL